MGRRRYVIGLEDRKQVVRLVLKYLKSKPCVDCGGRYPPPVMDFDHVRGKKVKQVGLLINWGDLKLLLDEVAKCDLLCANCHRLRTWTRKTQK